MGNITARWSTRIIGILIAILIILVTFLTVIDWAAFDLNFYRREYEKLNIPESTGMNQDDLLKVTQELLDYIRGKRKI